MTPELREARARLVRSVREDASRLADRYAGDLVAGSKFIVSPRDWRRKRTAFRRELLRAVAKVLWEERLPSE